MPRHRHRRGYFCLVLSGGYEEAGDGGRVRARAGDVVFHRPFEAHLDRFWPAGADTLNFELDGWSECDIDFASTRDPDQIARAAERDAREAREMLLGTLIPAAHVIRDWPDALAIDIRCDPNLSLSKWAMAHRLAPATVSRGFGQVYGIAPVAFRAQMRARHGWHAIVHTVKPLSAVAAENGFADQAHMTRGVVALTGATPAAWRLPHIKWI